MADTTETREDCLDGVLYALLAHPPRREDRRAFALLLVFYAALVGVLIVL